MLPILEAEAALTDEFEEQLIYDAGGLQQVLRAFATKELAGDVPQTGIDEIEKMLDGPGLALAPFAEQQGDLAALGIGLVQASTLTRLLTTLQPTARV